MAADNAWKTIAEVYRNREHKLILALQELLKQFNDMRSDVIDLEDHLPGLIADHLSSTGRDPEKPVEVPEIISPVQDARKELLALLGPSEAEVRAHLSPLAGLPRVRKQRSDKGKKRGPRKPKGDV